MRRHTEIFRKQALAIPYYFAYNLSVGAVAQLIERYIRIVEVEGLNPFSSTN